MDSMDRCLFFLLQPSIDDYVQIRAGRREGAEGVIVRAIDGTSATIKHSFSRKPCNLARSLEKRKRFQLVK